MEKVPTTKPIMKKEAKRLPIPPPGQGLEKDAGGGEKAASPRIRNLN